MIWLLRPDQPRPTEFAPAMDESTGILPGLPAVAGKPVHVAFDGGRLTSDAGILLLAAIEQRLGIAERLADCIEDPRAPERVRHGLSEMIRYRALLIGKRCSAGTFRFGGGRMILGADGGSDTCRFQSISICRSRSGALKCSRVRAGGEVGRARRRRRSSPRATGQARRSVPSRASTG